MTITPAQLRAEFREFETLEDSQIQPKLDEAYRCTPVKVWRAKQDDGAKYLAAHLLALSPYARELKLVSDDGSTIYEARRKQLARGVAFGFRVTGGDGTCP